MPSIVYSVSIPPTHPPPPPATASICKPSLSLCSAPLHTRSTRSAGYATSLALLTSGLGYTREGLGENLPYPGVDYLGVGYDLLRGNPEGDKDTFVDPGFRLPVIELEWKQSDPHLSRDYQNLQPIGGWAMPETSCNQAQSSKTASSVEDYQSELAVAASVSGEYDGGVGSAAFSASVESESFQKDVVDKNSERYVVCDGMGGRGTR